MSVDEGFVMAGWSLVSRWRACTVLALCPGLASALQPVQTSIGATATSRVTLLLTISLSLCKRRNSQDPVLTVPQCPGPLHLLCAAVTLSVTPPCHSPVTLLPAQRG